MAKRLCSQVCMASAENVYLTEHVALLGNIPSDYPLPAGNKTLYWQYNKEFLPDPFHHELAVLIHSGCGDIVISSCTHKGILNTLQAAKNFSGKAPYTLSEACI